MNHRNVKRKAAVVLLMLLLSGFYSHAQTIVNVMIDQPLQLQLEGSELYTETVDSYMLGEDLSVVGGVPPYQYFWYNNGVLVGTSLVVEVPKPQSSLAFELTVMDVNHCSVTVDENTVTVNDLAADTSGITVYPNPVKDFFTISPNGSNEKLDVCIYDSKGILMQQNEISGMSTVAINLAPGLYFLRVERKDKQMVVFKKLIVS